MTEVRITAYASGPSNLENAVTGSAFIEKFSDKKKVDAFNTQLDTLQSDDLDLSNFVSVEDVDNTLPNPDDFKTMRVSEELFSMGFKLTDANGVVSDSKLIKRDADTGKLTLGIVNWVSKHNPYVTEEFVREHRIGDKAQFLLTSSTGFEVYEKYLPIRLNFATGVLTSAFQVKQLPQMDQDNPFTAASSNGGTEIMNVSQYEKQVMVYFQTTSRERLDLRRSIVLMKSSSRERESDSTFLPVSDNSLQSANHYRHNFLAQSGGLSVELSDNPHIYTATFTFRLAPTDGFTVFMVSDTDIGNQSLTHGGLGEGVNDNTSMWVREVA